MNCKTTLALVCAVGLGLGACDGDIGETDGSGGEGGQNSQPLALESDDQVVRVVQTANNGEVLQAQTAMPRLSDPDVQSFAALMVSAHTENNQILSILINDEALEPQSSALSDQLEAESDQIVATIASAPAAEVDKVYIETQVNAHTHVLQLLDQELIPAADDEEVREFLEATRIEVEDHLAQANQLNNAIGTP